MITNDNLSYAYGGGSSTLSWSHVLASLGVNGLILVTSGGCELGGEQDPEETNSITFNGIAMHKIADANRTEDGMSLYYLYGSEIPVAGTYTVTITYKGNGTPNYSEGVCSSWKGARNQAYEALASNTWQDANGGNINSSITTVSPDSLFYGCWKERTDVDYTQTTTHPVLIVLRNGSESRMMIVYDTVRVPAPTNYQINPVNPETNMMIVASFAPQPSSNLLGADI
jgi:hypothetical protein